jgi:hypothetical protein
MDHQDALRMQACERYMLGDLSSSDQEDFEEHFFTCAECAEDLRLGAVFKANARAVFSEQSRRPPATSPSATSHRGLGWWTWLRPAMAAPVAAALALLSIVAYQNAVTIPRLQTAISEVTAPQSVPSFPLKIARGDEPIIVPKKAQSFILNFYLPQDVVLPTYIGEIQTPAGAKLRSLALPHSVPGQPFMVLLRSSDFPAGAYVLKVYTAGRTEIAAYRFDLKFE